MTKYKVGDQLDFRLTICEIGQDGRVWFRFNNANDGRQYIAWRQKDSVQPINYIPAPDPPLKVGDEVCFFKESPGSPSSSAELTKHTGIILAIDNGLAWVKEAGKFNKTLYLSDLERVKA